MVDITKCDLYGGVNIGLYATAGNRHLLVPSGFAPAKAQALADVLGVVWHAVSISGTRLLGAMSAHNGNGMILPKTVLESEYGILRDLAGASVVDARYTALGNLVCANDRGAAVSPLFDGRERRDIQDILGVEVVPVSVGGYEYTGTLAATNNSGTVVHPMAEEDEMELISDILGTRVEPSTINNGVPYVASGILINDAAAAVGSATTGPEIMMLTRAFLG